MSDSDTANDDVDDTVNDDTDDTVNNDTDDIVNDDTDEPSNQSRAFVLGLDGVPWRLLQEWVDDGELDHFARLIEEGAAGPLSSTKPATTPLAWPSIVTGCRPDKHGIYGFRRPQSDYTQKVYTAEDLSRPPLWELLSPAVVGNVPMTYPVIGSDGSAAVTGSESAIVGGMMTPGSASPERFVYPSSLREEIDTRIPDYEVGLTWHQYDGPTAEFLADLETLVENRRELMQLLMERTGWRLFFFVYTAPDRLQHLTWDLELLLDHYRVLDEVVGEVMAYVEDQDATLYVVSDHGFGPVDAHVAPNQVLADEGLFVRQEPSGISGVLDDLGVTRERLAGAFRSAGLDPGTVVERLPATFREGVASRVPGEHALYDMEYGETVAFVHELGNVYVNDAERFDEGAVNPDDIPEIKRDLIEVFTNVTDPETGQPALEVYDGDELFPTDPDSPDLVVEGRKGYEVTPELPGDAFAPAGKKVASHRPEGILLAWGPDVDPGATPMDATVYDVAPTLLHGIGEPIPEGVDGRVLTEIFEPGSAPANHEPRIRRHGQASTGTGDESPEDDFGDVEDRLRGLGYLN